jgi:hypothetical protein
MHRLNARTRSVHADTRCPLIELEFPAAGYV